MCGQITLCALCVRCTRYAEVVKDTRETKSRQDGELYAALEERDCNIESRRRCALASSASLRGRRPPAPQHRTEGVIERQRAPRL